MRWVGILLISKLTLYVSTQTPLHLHLDDTNAIRMNHYTFASMLLHWSNVMKEYRSHHISHLQINSIDKTIPHINSPDPQIALSCLSRQLAKECRDVAQTITGSNSNNDNDKRNESNCNNRRINALIEKGFPNNHNIDTANAGIIYLPYTSYKFVIPIMTPKKPAVPIQPSITSWIAKITTKRG